MDDLKIFNQLRSYLFAIAYRMLGSVMDAEDILQETYLRWQNVAGTNIKLPKSYLSTVVTRLCLDQLKSAKRQREEYLGPWLPEPVNISQESEIGELADSLSIAVLVLLESLSPVERAVFILRETFGYTFAEIAHIVKKSEVNCRQILHRAKKQIDQRKERFTVSPDQHNLMLSRFMETCRLGNLDELVSLLADDVELWSDGGGKVAAATKPVAGALNVGRFLLGVLRKSQPDLTIRIMPINGRQALVTYLDRRPLSVLSIDSDLNKINKIYIIVNPDKLKAIPLIRV